MSVLITIEGQCDLTVGDRLKSALAEAEHASDLVIDLTKLSFMDSTCLSELLLLHKKRASSRRPPITMVIDPGSPLRRVLHIADAERLFKTVGSIGELEPVKFERTILLCF